MNKQNIITLAVLTSILATFAFVTLFLYFDKKNAISEEAQVLLSGGENEAVYIDILGRPVSLTEYLGKVIVITSWASWSPFSATDIATLNKVAESTGDNVIYLAINRKETREQVQRFAATIPAPENVTLVIDTDDYFYRSTGGYAMPETIILDTKGNKVEHIRGQISDEDLLKLIATLEVDL